MFWGPSGRVRFGRLGGIMENEMKTTILCRVLQGVVWGEFKRNGFQALEFDCSLHPWGLMRAMGRRV